MMDPQFLTCLLAVTLLTLSPGMDTVLVLRNSARGGFTDGAISSLGICCGLFVHATLSALGISLLLATTNWAFTLLQLVGGGYLCWLGLISLRRAVSPSPSPGETQASPAKSESLWRSFREGFLSNTLNPKTVIFFMAFLPQFIDPAEAALPQSLQVAALHFTVAMVYQCALAAMVGGARRRLHSPRLSRLAQALCGSFFVAFGLRLVMRG
jgi:RhtB (resistance to homoserine/threonine) family protein